MWEYGVILTGRPVHTANGLLYLSELDLAFIDFDNATFPGLQEVAKIFHSVIEPLCSACRLCRGVMGHA